jgi:hypothetical protein
MALISSFSQIESDVSRVHGPVECGYRTFERDGDQYLQLDTYGSKERQIRGKTSQTLQLNRSGAAELKRILSKAFPGI